MDNGQTIPATTSQQGLGEASTKPNILELDRQELQAALSRIGQAGFRAAQLHRWLYSQGAVGFEAMSSLGSDLRRQLGENWSIRHAIEIGRVGDEACEPEQTVKYLMKMPDGELVESVLIPAGDRMTACVSSQAGCALQCGFCATGHMGFRRNLHAFEMTDQVFRVQREAARRNGTGLTNIVFMGMGEPLLNFDNLVEAVATLSRTDYDFGLSEKRITISTAGIVPGIDRLAASGLRTKLAISLHSAGQRQRETMMPVSRQYPLELLGQAVDRYNAATGLPVTFVYMLLDNINDTPEDARRLARFARRFLCKINLIDYNSIVNFQFRPAYTETRDAFVRQLLDAGLQVTVRKSQGATINAACGQLATQPGPYDSEPQ